jgi:3-(3-hydroxy-phenyl)propionate hydroxylase
MNSGLRDATNLAWKLAEVVKGEEQARRFWGLTELEKTACVGVDTNGAQNWCGDATRSMIGALAVQGLLKLVCVVPNVRDYFLNLKFKPKPRFEEGFFDHDSPKEALIACGQLMIQPWLENPLGQRLQDGQHHGRGFCGARLCRCARDHVAQGVGAQGDQNS